MRVLEVIVKGLLIVGFLLILGSAGSIDYMTEIGSTESIRPYIIEMLVGLGMVTIALGIGKERIR